MSETRVLRLNPDLLHTVKPEALKLNGEPVTVESWHCIHFSSKTKEIFPKDTRVGFVKELCMDFPESELI